MDDLSTLMRHQMYAQIQKDRTKRIRQEQRREQMQMQQVNPSEFYLPSKAMPYRPETFGLKSRLTVFRSRSGIQELAV